MFVCYFNLFSSNFSQGANRIPITYLNPHSFPWLLRVVFKLHDFFVFSRFPWPRIDHIFGYISECSIVCLRCRYCVGLCTYTWVCKYLHKKIMTGSGMYLHVLIFVFSWVKSVSYSELHQPSEMHQSFNPWFNPRHMYH